MRILFYIIPCVLPLAIASRVSAQPANAAPPPASAQAPATSAPPVEDLTQTIQTSPPAPEPAPAATPQASPGQNAAPAAPPPMVTQSVLSAPPAAAPATEPLTADSIHRGFYMRFGSGMGLVAMSGDGPRGSASVTSLGGLSTVALGGSIARGVVLGGTISSSGATAKFKGGPYENRSIVLDDRTVAASSKADAAFTQLGLLVDWFPDPVGGWHVGASVGFGMISLINRADDNTDNALIGSSVSGSLFGGYDWAIGKDWSLGLSLTASGLKSTTLKYADDSSDSGYKLRGASVGIQGSLLYF